MIPLNTETRLPGAAGAYLVVTALVPLLILMLTFGLIAYSGGGTCSGNAQMCDFLKNGGNTTLFIGILVLLGVFLIAYRWLWYSLFSFTLTERGITVNSGVLFRQSKTIDSNRMQNVNNVRGPIQMLFGLTGVQIWTASPDQVSFSTSYGKYGGRTTVQPKPDGLLILKKDDAEWIRDYLTQRGSPTGVPAQSAV